MAMLTYNTFVEFILEEAQLQGKSPEEFLTQYRQQREDDDEQERFELYAESLELIQAEARLDRDQYEMDLEFTREECGDTFLNDRAYGLKPPYPVTVLGYEKVYSHAGFISTHQSICCFVMCDDDVQRYVEWTSVLCHHDDSIDEEMKWYTKDMEPLNF